MMDWIWLLMGTAFGFCIGLIASMIRKHEKNGGIIHIDEDKITLQLLIPYEELITSEELYLRVDVAKSTSALIKNN